MDDINQLPFKKKLPPHFSLLSYFWTVILVTVLIAGFMGYLLGLRISQYNQSLQQQGTQTQTAVTPGTPSMGNDNDSEYFRTIGTITTNTSYYDQLYVYADQWKNGRQTHLQQDYRLIYKAQKGVTYPYAFDRLEPTLTYVFYAYACHSDSLGYCVVYTKKVMIPYCSGTLQGTNCIIKATSATDGSVDFLVSKKLSDVSH